MPVSGVTQPLLLPGIPYEDIIVPTLHALLGTTGNHLAQGFNNALEELDNTDPVALAKARELRDVIAELEALFLAYRSQLLKALEEAEVRAEAAEEEEGDEDEDEGMKAAPSELPVCLRGRHRRDRWTSRKGRSGSRGRPNAGGAQSLKEASYRWRKSCRGT
jgi:hypothetical protein